jgi:hypothetical protein
MTYTINGKEYTELDINKRCAELMEIVVKLSIDKKHWLLPSSIRNGGGFNPYSPCNNPSDTDAIIDKCWDELNLKFISKITHVNSNTTVYEALNKDLVISKWEVLVQQHKCTKLVAACICYIELNE